MRLLNFRSACGDIDINYTLGKMSQVIILYFKFLTVGVKAVGAGLDKSTTGFFFGPGSLNVLRVVFGWF